MLFLTQRNAAEDPYLRLHLVSLEAVFHFLGGVQHKRKLVVLKEADGAPREETNGISTWQMRKLKLGEWYHFPGVFPLGVEVQYKAQGRLGWIEKCWWDCFPALTLHGIWGYAIVMRNSSITLCLS